MAHIYSRLRNCQPNLEKAIYVLKSAMRATIMRRSRHPQKIFKK